MIFEPLSEETFALVKEARRLLDVMSEENPSSANLMNFKRLVSADAHYKGHEPFSAFFMTAQSEKEMSAYYNGDLFEIFFASEASMQKTMKALISSLHASSRQKHALHS